MALPVLAEVKQNRVLRKFDTADLSVHGKWVMPRMLKAFPHMNERSIASFLQSILWHNEYRVLFQDDSMAMFQVMPSYGLDPRPIVWERFVWCENPEDKEQQKHAAEFYVEIHRWAKTLGVDTVVVAENSDVPHEQIKEKLGRIYERQQRFARL